MIPGLVSQMSALLRASVARCHGPRAVGEATALESNPLFAGWSRAVWLEYIRPAARRQRGREHAANSRL
eukprot:6265947-Pyramimonas_sp.AAC.1